METTASVGKGTVRIPQRESQIVRETKYARQIHTQKSKDRSIKLNIKGQKLITKNVHGEPLGEKPPGTARIIFENFNGLAPWYPRNDKINLARRFLHRIKADCYAGVECRAQWDMLQHKSKLEQLFKSEVQIRAVSSHNIHENDTRAQEGGTCIIAFDHFAGLVHSTGVDTSGLGRWSWTLIKGKHNHATRIISAYNPCTSKKTSLSSVGAQHRRYHRQRGRNKCPRALFRIDLIK